MHMNISYINMCKLKKNREWRKELEKVRERLVVMVCVVVHLVNHLNKKPGFIPGVFVGFVLFFCLFVSLLCCLCLLSCDTSVVCVSELSIRDCPLLFFLRFFEDETFNLFWITKCCPCLWIVHLWLPYAVSPTLFLNTRRITFAEETNHCLISYWGKRLPIVSVFYCILLLYHLKRNYKIPGSHRY